MRTIPITAVLIAALLAGCGLHGKAAKSGRDRAGGIPDRMIHFPTAGHRAAESSRGALESNARWMGESTSSVVILEGHCDERGTREYNLELGDRRARWVMGEMVRRGIDPARFVVLSRGEDEPIDPGSNESAWSMNRRVEFIVR